MNEKEFSNRVVSSMRQIYGGDLLVRVTDPEYREINGRAYRSAENKGRPDLIGVFAGLHFEFELKAGSTLKKAQVKQLNACKNAGGFSAVVFYHKRTCTVWIWFDKFSEYSVRKRKNVPHCMEIPTFNNGGKLFINFSAINHLFAMHMIANGAKSNDFKL